MSEGGDERVNGYGGRSGKGARIGLVVALVVLLVYQAWTLSVNLRSPRVIGASSPAAGP
jgi:hypothetical protein